MTFKLVSSFVVIFIVFVFVVVASGAGWNPFGVNWDFTNTGAFGDSFGPLNSIMTAFAAFAAYLAYKTQSDELDRIKEDAEAEKKARETRDFENTFFNLLQLFRDAVKEIEVEDRYNANPKSGRDAIRQFLEEHADRILDLDEDYKSAYLKAYRIFRDDLGHYFRIFYHILKLIDDSSIENKKRYSRILRSTLSEAEIKLIAINCIYGGGYPKLKLLVERYSMLHNISKGSHRSWGISNNLKRLAFGSRKILPNGELSD